MALSVRCSLQPDSTSPVKTQSASGTRRFSKTSDEHYGVISKASIQVQEPREAGLAVPVVSMVKVCVLGTRPPVW